MSDQRFEAPSETFQIMQQKVCSTWATETFGQPSSLYSILARANEEMAEMVRAVSKLPDNLHHAFDEDCDKIAEECADVMIIMYRFADRMDTELLYDGDGPEPLYVWQSANLANRHMADLLDLVAGKTLLRRIWNHGDRIRMNQMLYYIAQNLANICYLVNRDLMVSIEKKMEKNRARKWNLSGDGHGYHVKETA